MRPFKNLNFILFFILMQLLVALGATASNAPAWITSKPKNDSKYKYYVGRSPPAATQADGFREATRDAFEKAIRENFGFSATVSTESYESLEKVSATRHVREVSQDVQLHMFELVDSITQGSDARWETWALYRYPRAEVSREKRRLDALNGASEPTFSVQGDESNIQQGIVEIVTFPSRATILIDHEPMGRTPTRLNSQLEPGEHSLRIEHQNYEPIEEIIVVVPGKVVRIDKTLIRAKGSLSIVSDPTSAFVVINGHPAGSTPIFQESVVAGEVIKIEVTHPDAERTLREVTVGRDEKREIILNLPLKPAFVSVNSDPSEAEVTIGAKYIGKTGTSKAKLIPVNPGDIVVELSKPGFTTERTSIHISGGQRVVLPTTHLVPLSEVERSLENPLWQVGFNVGLSTSAVRSPDIATNYLGLTFRRHLAWRISALIGYSQNKADANYSDGRLKLVNDGIVIGFPLQISGSLTLIPEWYRIIDSKYQADFRSGGGASITGPAQESVGFIIEYRVWDKKFAELGMVIGLGLEAGIRSPIKNTNSFSGKISELGGIKCFVGF